MLPINDRVLEVLSAFLCPYRDTKTLFSTQQKIVKVWTIFNPWHLGNHLVILKNKGFYR